jgi:FMN-dependent oxidoreductase (nitrilotriacetate monooxygenase family)
MNKPTQLILNAFEMACPGHICHGLWTHPQDQSHRFGELDYWIELARTLEGGFFDGVFFADGLGAFDVYQNGYAKVLAEAIQLPRLDPMLLVPSMAHATQHLGFGITSNVLYEPPALFARRLSTLDQLTGGRVGWNVVTGYLDSAAKANGNYAQPGHDERYERADDYMDVVYKLWEQSWNDGAVRQDRERRVYSDPASVTTVSHDGPFYKLDSPHLCAPSPQRTPVIYQAGASDRGRVFAATHAECVFVMGPSKEVIAAVVRDIRQAVHEQGRDPYSIRILAGINVVVDENEPAARAKFDEYRRYANPEAGLAHFSATVGIDFSRYDLDEPIVYQHNQAGQSALEAFTKRSPGKVWTVRKLLDAMPLGSRILTLVGDGSSVADELCAWQKEADIDGFNLIRSVTPQSVHDFIRWVVPELQARGVYKTAYEAGTLREKLFGSGPHLPDGHYGADFRTPQSLIKKPRQ